MLWADSARTRHVALVLEMGSDPLLVSHGSEPGPLKIRFIAEHRYFQKKYGASIQAYWLTLPSEDRRALIVPPVRLKALAPLPESDPPAEEPLGEPAPPFR